MYGLYVKKLDKLVQDKIKTKIILLIPDLEKFANMEATDSIKMQLEQTLIYDTSVVQQPLHEIFEAQFEKSKTSEYVLLYNYLEMRIDIMLDSLIAKIITLLKYSLLYDNLYIEDVTAVLESIKGGKLPKTKLKRLIGMSRQFNISECWYTNGDMFVARLQELYENTPLQIQADNVSTLSDLENHIIDVYENNLITDFSLESPIYLVETYPTLFLEYRLQEGRELLKNKQKLFSFIYRYLRYVDVIKDKLPYTLSFSYLSHVMVAEFYNNLCMQKEKVVHEKFIDRVETYICAYIDNSAYSLTVDIDQLYTSIYTLGFLDEWHLVYYMEHNDINKIRLSQAIENYITAYHKTNEVTTEDNEKLYGIREDDKKRVARLQQNLLEHGLIEHACIQPVVHAIVVKTNKGYFIEIHPNWLKIRKVGSDKTRTVYQRNGYDTVLAAYVNAVKPSMFPYLEDSQKYLLHELIIKSYDLRRK